MKIKFRFAKKKFYCVTRLEFSKSGFQNTKLTIEKKTKNCRKTQLMWHGRLYGCGLWLPEDKKVKCDMEGETFVACYRLPSPANPASSSVLD